MGHIHITEQLIDIKHGAKPFKWAPCSPGPAVRKLKAFKLKKLLEAGVIEPAASEWATPVLYVPKMDGQLRF